MMSVLRCGAYECIGIAVKGYPACSKKCGYELKQFKELFEDESELYQLTRANAFPRSPYSPDRSIEVGMLNYYAQRYDF